VVEPLNRSVRTLRDGETEAETRLSSNTSTTFGKATLPIKRIYITTIIVFALIWTASGCAGQFAAQNGVTASDDSEIGRAFKTRTSNVQVEGEGIVQRILEDDLAGSRHQRFIVRLASGQTLLIAHNIDIARRVAGLEEGDSIRFYGEYVWNSHGGMVHWTHHDTEGRHVAGWLKHKGQTYQ
jgi:Protein of unknown function (DUF3465)